MNNSDLEAMPTHKMPLFPMPGRSSKSLMLSEEISSGKVIKKEKRNIIWLSGCCYNQQKRGRFGIKKLKDQNKSLLLKWLWRLASDDRGLWKDIIAARYVREGPWTTKDVNIPYGVGLWRTISNKWPSM